MLKWHHVPVNISKNYSFHSSIRYGRKYPHDIGLCGQNTSVLYTQCALSIKYISFMEKVHGYETLDLRKQEYQNFVRQISTGVL